MSKRIGVCCILLGMIFLLASVGLIVYNRFETRNGETYSQEILQDIREKMETGAAAAEEAIPNDPVSPLSRQMLTVPAGEYESIGILSIPALELEVPVLTEWSYEKLKKAPCHYYGSCYDSDFVIAGHNYPSHFGRLSELLPGDLIFFTDGAGEVHCYEVILLETLVPIATEEMITSGFDLSLYTCTPGGSNRVTVRCNKVKN